MRKPRDGCSGRCYLSHYRHGLKKGESKKVYPRWLVKSDGKITLKDAQALIAAPKYKRERKTAHLNAKGQPVGNPISGRKAIKRWKNSEAIKRAEHMDRMKAAGYA